MDPLPNDIDNKTNLQEESKQKEIRLVDIPINDENTALNVMVGFLHTAHKRGVFTIDESAKIWECISKFHKQ
jgi:glutathione synthase/RimK-type ligase-like ATP-grasp enzyme